MVIGDLLFWFLKENVVDFTGINMKKLVVVFTVYILTLVFVTGAFGQAVVSQTAAQPTPPEQRIFVASTQSSQIGRAHV